MVHRCACLVHGTANEGFDPVGEAADALAGHLRCFILARPRLAGDTPRTKQIVTSAPIRGLARLQAKPLKHAVALACTDALTPNASKPRMNHDISTTTRP
ncbi:hypothetical protein THIX_20082 [Thiomonas sp. X19]|nr:hypothetical protein THIX_20082 [Thiomonas sp. X19]